ncbi:MAG: hypothetical protein M1823_001074 [Watsoniomyces obsoletus]|nr:MAG: hypothetical protein M1823_001074 [Watsoniomyces obsoletus]
MDRVKGVVKGGWHPERKESWRGDFKGLNQVAGWVGKGKDESTSSSREEHQAAPLSSLKDPALFGPPPKHVGYHRVAPNASPRTNVYPDSHVDRYAQEDHGPGPGIAVGVAESGRQKPAPPPTRPRRNTGDASPDAGPPLPMQKPTFEKSSISRADVPPTVDRPPLPPRLPPRNNTVNPVEGPSVQPEQIPLRSKPTVDTTHANSGAMNRAALYRLGQAGVSVPGFGIGSKTLPPPAPQDSTSNVTGNPEVAGPATGHQLPQMTSRFSNLSTGNGTDAPKTGTSMAQKQAALQTMSSFHKDPTSVSMADARSAASTANNFRQRHGDEVVQGYQTANEMNTKYGVVDKAGAAASSANGALAQQQTTGTIPLPAVLGPKKSPPPIPMKSALRGRVAATSNGAPPVPIASKPQ